MRHPFPNPSESQKWVSGKVLVCHILFFITKHRLHSFYLQTIQSNINIFQTVINQEHPFQTVHRRPHHRGTHPWLREIHQLSKYYILTLLELGWLQNNCCMFLGDRPMHILPFKGSQDPIWSCWHLTRRFGNYYIFLKSIYITASDSEEREIKDKGNHKEK